MDAEVQVKSKDIYSIRIPVDNPANTSTRALSDYTIVMPDAEIEVSTQTIVLGNISTYHLLVEVEGRVNGKLTLQQELECLGAACPKLNQSGRNISELWQYRGVIFEKVVQCFSCLSGCRD